LQEVVRKKKNWGRYQNFLRGDLNKGGGRKTGTRWLNPLAGSSVVQFDEN